ncbi:hypothetical protein ABZ949_02670 [Micromonospora tulbaghiae]|uniref:hypothetical protein n=1 Tax=Micromonospora tulbaghiae TaxID=479978 RepID=UPI0033E26CB1
MAEMTGTPEQAEAAGDRWRWRGYTCFAVAVVFAVFGLDNLFWLALVVGLVFSRRATEEFAWRRGYLEGTRAAGDRS